MGRGARAGLHRLLRPLGPGAAARDGGPGGFDAALRAVAWRGRVVVVGFAAETENLIEAATNKLGAKGCDWMVANDVSPNTGTFGGDTNTVHLIDATGVEDWPALSKDDVGRRLVDRIALQFGSENR